MAIPEKTGHTRDEAEASGSGLSRHGNQIFNFHLHQTVQETEDEGTHLFVDFLRDQTSAEGVNFNPAEYGIESRTNAESAEFQEGSVESVQDNPNWAFAGRNLKRLADEFAASQGRQEVRKEADKVDLNSITYESFRGFLSEYFEDNRNPAERIVTLFFFCSDLVIKSIKKKVGELTKQLFLWSIKFIVEKVCKWVSEHGGWNSILGSFYQNLLKVGATVATIVLAFGILISVWKYPFGK